MSLSTHCCHVLRGLPRRFLSSSISTTTSMRKRFTIMTAKEVSMDPAIKELRNAIELAESGDKLPQVMTSLQKVMEMVKLKTEFNEATTSPDTEPCSAIIKATDDNDWKGVHEQGKTSWQLRPLMVSGHIEGQFLKSVVSMQNAKRILDIGMFTGYSALSMAEALPDDGELVTVDKEKYLAEFTGSLLKASPHAKKIHIHIGPALEYMKQCVQDGRTFDVIFLDADKKEYPDYLKIAFDEGLLAPRGTILIDNVYFRGAAYMPEAGDNANKQLAAAIKANTSMHCVVLPMCDGVAIVRRRSDVFQE